MFGWLADLLVKSPVVGSSCSCCERQKEQLKKMQKAVLSGEFEDFGEFGCGCSGSCSCEKNDQQPFEMTTSYHYKL